MQIELYYDFEKDIKSTKTPDGTGDIKDVKLKENTSIFNPTFILTLNQQRPSYVRWDFNFYFITNITLVSNSIYELDCSLDELATYKNVILNSTQFVLRSASNFDTYIPDNRVLPKGIVITDHIETNIQDFSGETIILRTIGATDKITGGINSYAINQLTLKNILTQLYNYTADGPFSDLELYNDKLNQAIFNPTNYIVSVSIAPIPQLELSEATKENVYFGAYDSGQEAHHCKKTYYTNGQISIPTDYYGDWRDLDDNFTKFKIYVPGYGNLTMPAKNVYAGLSFEFFFDSINGVGVYLIKDSDGGHIYAKLQCKFATETQIGGKTTTTDTVSNAWSNTLHQVAGSLGGILAGTISNFEGIDINKQSVGEVIAASFQDVPSTVGTMGSVADIQTFHKIVVSREVVVSTNPPVFNEGRPLNQYIQLSNLSGFCQCDNPLLSTNAPESIKSSIINKMSSGFYIE